METEAHAELELTTEHSCHQVNFWTSPPSAPNTPWLVKMTKPQNMLAYSTITLIYPTSQMGCNETNLVVWYVKSYLF
jgi:hypothetical protein